ncbi:efflux RND transporter permease subunit [Deefgea piscis]|uniref:Efflux RND transporter permease subunit n=1 Tax=Deefgea piscis TaxID=2739061 RepID=A0A6M8SR79_9NEIS|nr:efflux RND transporter permease subunit [Deefgea piscis]QKJ65806.1 efflux RND transporter permease subunit [Deefgea piscis]
MNFSAWSIKNPIPAIMLFVLLSLGGLWSFSQMKVQDFPDIELPMVTVTAVLEGAAPAQLETEVARKLENSVSALQGVKHVYSNISDGVVGMTVEFELEKPINEAVDDVRDAVSNVRSDLPADLKDPIIGKVEFSGVPFLVYTVADPQLDEEQLSWLVDNKITRVIRAIPGVGKVSRVGGVTRQVQIELDPARMAALGVSSSDISRQLARTQKDASGGRADLGGSEQALRTIIAATTAAELAQTELSLPDGRRIRLDQIASIHDTIAERRSIAQLDGQPVVGFEITRARGASETEVAAAVKKALAQLQLEHPALILNPAYDMAAPVQDEFDGSMGLLYEGALLAVIVVWFFLRDWRATLVSAAALPLSILPTFIGMYLFGFTLNTVTLLSLALVVGILVDDAIVEIENIVRHLRMGKSPYQAAMEAADEIGLAVVATTFALVAVFLPTAFMSGIPGKFFKPFGWTAALAVMASLVVARLLTPMMAAYLLKPMPHAEQEGRLKLAYLRCAAWCLRHRKITAICSIVFFIASLALVPLLPTGFVPPDDRSQTLVKIELPPGATLNDTYLAADQARKILAPLPFITRIYTAVGDGKAGSDPFAGGSSGVNKASLTLTLVSRSERAKKTVLEQELRELLRVIPGARVTVGLGQNGEKLQMIIKSDDPEALAVAAKAVEKDLRTLNGIGAVTSSASLVRPELIIRPDMSKAAEMGVTALAIADTIRVATVGDFDTALAKLNLPERQIPIVVRLPDSFRSDLEQIKRLRVPSTQGDVMLGQVATVEIGSGPSVISRYDRARNVIFDVELNGRTLGEASAEADQLPSLKNLPAGVTRAVFGDAEEMKKLFASFGLAMLTGVLCIYMVLVLLFRDFMQPVTILAALPLSIGGAFVALLLTHSSFSMPTLIGLIMLMGVATKNSILLVEYAIVARREGMARFDALMDAGRKRARPIVMTTIAMGAGMLPIAMGWGVDSSFRAPMAIAVIGGLITSTFLSLLVIPVVFTFVDDFVQWMSSKRKKVQH